MTLVCGIITGNLLNSTTGRAIRALKSRTIMAESVGVDTFALKLRVCLWVALFAAVAGWLYAHLQRFVNPTPFSLAAGVEYVFMTVVGGAAHVLGAVLGAFTINIFNDILQDVLSSNLLGRAGNFEMAFFGVAIIDMLQRAQNGLAAVLLRLRPQRPVTIGADDQPSPRTAGARRPGFLLRIDGVTRRFGGLVAMDDVSFSVGGGEIVALIGPNGAGKSTMFNLITGVLRPDAGAIHFDGRRLDRLTSHAIARAGIARTFQHVKLLADRTVLENAALGTYRLAGSACCAPSRGSIGVRNVP